MKIQTQVEFENNISMEDQKFFSERNAILTLRLGENDRIITLGENLAPTNANYAVAILIKENSNQEATYFMVVEDENGNLLYEKELKKKIPPDLSA